MPDANGSAVAFLPNPKSGLTPAEAAALPDEAWRPWARGFLPSSHREAAWVRVILRNPEATVAHGVLSDALDYADKADLFTPGDAPGSWLHLRSGEWTPAGKKALWGRETAFPLTVPAQGERKVYLRYEDSFMVWLQLDWWPDQNAFHASRLRTALAEGFYFGGLLALLFYNATLWARLRFSDTGYYLLYLGSFTIYLFFARSELAGLGGALGSPWLETISMVALALSGAFLAQFVRVLLELPVRTPTADKVTKAMRTVMVLLALGAVAAPWVGYENWLSYIVLGSATAHLVLLGAAVAAWRAGARQARYFVVAFGLLFAGIAPVAASWLSWLSISNVITVVMLASALEMLLLSLATADRFAQIQREKLDAQQSLLAEAQQRQILQEAYADELALEVREQTRELEAANHDKDRMIAVLGHDLRSPLTGLTQAAEQLVAAPPGRSLEQFASDTARTGRELLLLIEDLVLWTRLRAGAEAARTDSLSVGTLMAPVVALHRTVAEQGKRELVIEVPEDLHVETDLVLAQTLLRNLLVNALKFARHRVVVSAALTPNGVRLAVRDDGPGLPREVAEQLAAESPCPPAARGGMGLHLCGEISRTMGIRLEAILNPGGQGGTELWFTLPAAEGRACDKGLAIAS